MTGLPRLARVLRAIVATGLLAFALGDYSGTPAFAQASPQEIGDAARAYVTGDGITAASILSQFAKRDMAPAQKLGARLFLAEVCDDIDDFTCFQNNNIEMLKLINAFDEKERRAVAAQIGPWLLRQNFLARDFQTLNFDQQIGFLNQLPYAALPDSSYLVLQTTAVGYALYRGDRNGARLAVSRLIARAAAMPSVSPEFALYIAQVLDSLHVMRDDYDALRLLVKFDDLLMRGLPARNSRRVNYLELSASLLLELNRDDRWQIAKDRLDEAREIATRSNIPAEAREDMLAQITIQESEAGILKGDVAAAAAAQARHPLQARRKAIQQEMEFSGPEDLYFAVMDIFLDRLQQKTPDAGWAKLLQRSKYGDDAEENLEPYKAYREFGLALMATPGSADWRRFVVLAAGDDIVRYDAGLFADARAFPLANAIDRVIVGNALGALANTPNLNPAEQRVVVRGIDFLQRSVRTRRDDDLFRVAAGASAAERKSIHHALLQGQDRTDAELDGLTTRASPAAAGPVLLPPDTTANAALPLQSLPGADAIASVLGPNEAFVSETVWENNLLKLCIAPGRFAFVATPVAPETNIQVKLLRAALPLENPPSEELDSQYPAAAAVALNTLALGGLNACLGDVSAITFSAAPFMADIPLGALLAKTPPAAGQGYDLATADFLVKKYVFAYVTSAEEFVAAKHLFAAAPVASDQPFLGIGDPVLRGREIGAPGAAPIGLEELPDTGAELKSIARIIPGAQLLTREHASEAQVRQTGLERFRIVEFATHGLLGSDADALAEPGLVLTPKPVPSGDPADDGFLSASEISAFDLSACNTANFETEKFNGGIRGLTASFALAGVPSTVASLWAVDSASSAKIMIAFFATLAKSKGDGVAAALTQAQREFLAAPPSRAYLHPRFWAAFSAYGDGTTPLPLTASR